MFEKIKTYLEEHPNVKKGLIIGGQIVGAAGLAFIAYQCGKSASSDSDPELYSPDAGPLELPEPVSEPLPFPEPEEHKLRLDIPVVDDEHVFDTIFRDAHNGDTYTAKESCMGSFVNDFLQSFDDTDIEISMEKGDIPDVCPET